MYLEVSKFTANCTLLLGISLNMNEVNTKLLFFNFPLRFSPNVNAIICNNLFSCTPEFLKQRRVSSENKSEFKG